MSRAPVAAIDVGSNSIHLLIGKLEDGHIHTLDDRTSLVRLAMDLAPDGTLNHDKMNWAADVIAEYHARAKSFHAEQVVLVATSAVREAPNGQDLVAMVKERTNLDLRIIPGDEEARLTFAGATVGRKLDGRLGVVDSGGGSTELILAHDGKILSAHSVPEGAGRTVERFLHDDPPSSAQAWALRVHMINALDVLPHPDIDRLILTGGSANNLRRIAHGRDGDERIEIGEAQEVLRMLARTSSTEVAARHGIDPLRARTLLGGVTIVITLWERSGLDQALICPTGIREGIVLRTATDRSTS